MGHKEIVQILLPLEGNLRTTTLSTPLMIASTFNQYELIQYLKRDIKQ